MKEKKSKLTISGNPKKSIDNIELAKSKNKNSVIIEKKPNRFFNKGELNQDKFRTISDYIAGMTDRYAINLYKKLK